MEKINYFNKKFQFIGSGNFGEVFEGRIISNNSSDKRNDETIRVAIKTLKNMDDDEDSIEFFKEAIAVSKLKHENIIQFLGVCEESNFMIFELMEGPELKKYLKSVRNTEYTISDLVQLCYDVVKGCAYLEKMQCVHRDLAARNCMLTSIDPIHRKVILNSDRSGTEHFLKAPISGRRRIFF